MWNRFWFLLSAVWMGLCWWMALRATLPPSTLLERDGRIVNGARLPDGKIDYYALEEGVRRPLPNEVDLQKAYREAITLRHSELALGLVGFALWLLGRFIKYGMAFGFRAKAST